MVYLSIFNIVGYFEDKFSIFLNNVSIIKSNTKPNTFNVNRPKKQIEQQLWNIANTLRGKMDADEFRDCILGFIFYKYLSEKIQFAADKILQDPQIDITYDKIQEDTT